MTSFRTTRREWMTGAAMAALGTAAGGGIARAQGGATTVKVGLLAPLSGICSRFGQLMRMGAELGIKHINEQGGVPALGGAKLELLLFDAGDST